MAIIFNLDKEEKEEPTLRLPAFLGGGSFIGKSTTNPKEMEGIKLERDVPEKEKAIIRGGSFQETRSEVDHIIPLALGGTNERENLKAMRDNKTISQEVFDAITGKERLPFGYKPKNRQEGKMVVEWEAINKYKSGEISLAEARGAVINWENPEVFLHKEVKPVKAGLGDVIKEIPGAITDIFKKKEEPKMRFEIGEGLDIPQEQLKKMVIMPSQVSKPTIFTGNLPDLIVQGFKEQQEKEDIFKWYNKVYPERTEKLTKLMPEILTEQGRNKLIKEGLITPEESEIYSYIPEYTPVITGMKEMGVKELSKIISSASKYKSGNQFADAIAKKFGTTVKEVNVGFKKFGLPNAEKLWEYATGKTTALTIPKISKVPPGFKGKPPIVTPPPTEVPVIPKATPTTPKPTIPKPPIPMPTPTVTPTKPLPEPIFKNFADLKTIPKENITDATTIITPKGNELPAVRNSGFYAEKDFDVSKIRDVYKQGESPYHISLMQDRYELGKEFGQMFNKVWKPTEQAIVQLKEFSTAQFQTIRDLANKHNISITKKTGEKISDILEGKELPTTDNEKLFVNEMRGYLDQLRETNNEVRRAMNRKEIGYIENYVPHLQKASLWSEMLSDRATLSDNLSFIVPNQTKNPFAFKRLLDELPKAERNFFTLIDRYVSATAKDIYYTPAIENIKAYNKVLKSAELFKSAQYWDEYIRTGLIGKQHKIDNSIGLGFKGRKAIQKGRRMLNLAFLTGKVSWSIVTQPLSYIMNTPMEAGFINTVKALFKTSQKSFRQYVKDNSQVLKIKSSDVRSVAVGEGREIQNRIYRTKIDKYNDFISMLGSVLERELTLSSYLAGLERAKDFGYTGQDALDFADLTAARTQSMYNRENRALILDSDITTLMFPFNSFKVEMWNHAKEVLTKESGAMKLTKRQRFGKLFRLLVGVYFANLWAKTLSGRKKTSIGTFVPFAGEYVDRLIARAMDKEYYGGRSPITVVGITEDIIQGSKDFIKHGNLKRLRKIGVNFGLALGGIGGGGQLNNIIDGLMADINEEVKDVSGKTLFEVRDLEDKVIAPIFGVWATKEGRSYWEEDEEEYKLPEPSMKLPTLPELPELPKLPKLPRL